MCFVRISEQTAIISLHSINWLVCITETECVYCAVRTGSLYIIQVMCFVWIWEQTAIISLYSINWLVCITETDFVTRWSWIVIFALWLLFAREKTPRFPLDKILELSECWAERITAEDCRWSCHWSKPCLPIQRTSPGYTYPCIWLQWNDYLFTLPVVTTKVRTPSPCLLIWCHV